jgi:hypothetical protein
MEPNISPLGLVLAVVLTTGILVLAFRRLFRERPELKAHTKRIWLTVAVFHSLNIVFLLWLTGYLWLWTKDLPW